ncbi:putative ankyrin repeat protein [Smittium mucronatum]|uniref:Putative ankyrin repeat protein n=1 Tax=Smittium mucronatum TaxID=133383 RepID=A0A1R0GNQ0_9FUNG|nr:putative ankyrin repeat protein [Smittium mucronatum]
MIPLLSYELQSRIFVLAQDPNLRYLSKTLYQISKLNSVRVDFMIVKFPFELYFDFRFGFPKKYPIIFHNQDLVLLLLKKTPLNRPHFQPLFNFSISNGWDKVVSFLLNSFFVKDFPFPNPLSNSKLSPLKALYPQNKLFPVVEINDLSPQAFQCLLENYSILNQLLDAHKIFPQSNFSPVSSPSVVTHQNLDFNKISESVAISLVIKKRLDIIKLLSFHGFDLSVYPDALFPAINNNDIQSLDFLLKNITIRNDKIDLLLSYACWRGSLDAVKTIIKNGANIYANNNQPITEAIRGKRLDIVKYLVEIGYSSYLNDLISLEKMNLQ